MLRVPRSVNSTILMQISRICPQHLLHEVEHSPMQTATLCELTHTASDLGQAAAVAWSIPPAAGPPHLLMRRPPRSAPVCQSQTSHTSFRLLSPLPFPSHSSFRAVCLSTSLLRAACRFCISCKLLTLNITWNAKCGGTLRSVQKRGKQPKQRKSPPHKPQQLTILARLARQLSISRRSTANA